MCTAVLGTQSRSLYVGHFLHLMMMAHCPPPIRLPFILFCVDADETQVAVGLVAPKRLNDTVLLAAHKIRPMEGAGAPAWWLGEDFVAWLTVHLFFCPAPAKLPTHPHQKTFPPGRTDFINGAEICRPVSGTRTGYWPPTTPPPPPPTRRMGLNRGPPPLGFASADTPPGEGAIRMGQRYHCHNKCYTLGAAVDVMSSGKPHQSQDLPTWSCGLVAPP